jgi:pimeloyl-ACP methyl ester carboxylesterase
MGGNSGVPAPSHTENRFVVDQQQGLDVEHQITASRRVVEVHLPTTRYVGTVDSDGFLSYGAAAVKAGRLAGTLRLTIRARIHGFDLGGILGWDGLEVEVFLHRGETGRERSLGTLEGDFGIDWENFTFDVNTLDVKFPDDPCPKQSPTLWCDTAPLTRWNKISFVFSGTTRMTLEIDWMTLETRDGVGLASRPVLLLHGWGQSAQDMGQGTIWADQLTARDIPWYANQLDPEGWFWQNAEEVALAIADMRRRFGVARVNIVGFGKGGIDARYYTGQESGADRLIMLASPNGGCFLSDIATMPLDYAVLTGYHGLEMTSLGTYLGLDAGFSPNPHVLYITISASYDSLWAQSVAHALGPNDEVVTTGSVEVPYAVNEPPYPTSVNDAESQGICAAQGLSNHSCLRFNRSSRPTR